MSRSESDDEWIYRLLHEQLVEELRRRELSEEESDSVLALWLLRRVNHARESFDQGRVTEMPNPENLYPPAGDPVRPDSPGAAMGPWTAIEAGGVGDVAEVHAPPHPANNSASTAYNIMRRWNLNFSGTRGEGAETFLLRIEEGRQVMSVSDADVLRCLPFFLSGIELHWFRQKRARFTTWAAFKVAWRARFGDPNFQFALQGEIMRRTQGERESVVDYFTCMNALFDRLSPPWSEEMRVGYAHRNMLPRLQIMVPARQF
jgi:hypothetical protein